MKKTDLLQRLGLDEKEAKIYISLIKSGPATVSKIAKNTAIHRPIIYKNLPSLIEKGIVTESFKGKLKYFVAESPEKLESLLESVKKDFKQLIPELKDVYDYQKKRPNVKYLDGKKGIRFVFEDIIRTLKKGDIFYRYSSARSFPKGKGYLPKDYRRIRDSKKLERFVITNKSQVEEKKPRMERAMKIVPSEFDLFDYNITQLIYADKIAFVDYNTETALIIENPVIAEFQRKIFKLLYHKL